MRHGPTVLVSEAEVLPRVHSLEEPLPLPSRRSTFDQQLPEYSHHRLPVYQYPPGQMRQISEASKEESREPSVVEASTNRGDSEE